MPTPAREASGPHLCLALLADCFSLYVAGLTAATGKWAEQVAARLRGAGLTCNVLNEDDFRASMFEKHMWISAFMLLGVHHGGTVGDVASKHADDLRMMVEEMMAVLQEERGVAFKAGVPERLLAYAQTVAHFPTALKELEWRNQFWLDLTRARQAAGIQHAPVAPSSPSPAFRTPPLPPHLPVARTLFALARQRTCTIRGAATAGDSDSETGQG